MALVKSLDPSAFLVPRHNPKLLLFPFPDLTGNKKWPLFRLVERKAAAFVCFIASVLWNADTALESKLENKAISLLIA